MNCSKVMFCSKSLPGNKCATHFDALRLCQVNTGTPTRTLVACLTAIRSRTAAVLTDNSWPVSSFPAIPSISLNTVFYTLNTCQPVPRSDSSLLPLLSTSLWIIELSLSRGPAPLIRCVGHQACFTAPSPVAEASPMLPHGIEEITHMPLTYFSLQHLLPLNLFSSSHPPNLFFK